MTSTDRSLECVETQRSVNALRMNRVEVEETSDSDDAEATIVIEVTVPEDEADEVEKKLAKKLGGHKKVR